MGIFVSLEKLRNETNERMKMSVRWCWKVENSFSYIESIRKENEYEFKFEFEFGIVFLSLFLSTSTFNGCYYKTQRDREIDREKGY